MKKKLIVILIVIGSIQMLKAQQIGDGWEQTVADFSQVLSSGGYSYPSPLAGVPDTDHPWQHLFVLRHQNASNNHQLQIGASYAVNDRLFFRKIAVGDLSQANTQWNELATRGKNVFQGSQSINGVITIYGNGLDGSSYQQSVIYSDISNGLYFDAPLKPDGSGLPINFAWRGSTPKITFLPNGSVGIGTTNTSGYKVNIDAGTTAGLSIFNCETSGNTEIRLGSAWSRKGVYSAGDMSILAESGLAFSGRGNNTDVYINNQGNVGIGTSTPNPLYKLDVAGSIRANEIKVNTTGADFVFEPTYKLRPLAEVETFIKANKHLPDVASAANMQTNGVSMGEMQAKLLQKVEELTLYSIEQSKQLKVQEQKNIALEQQIAQQNNKLAQQDSQYQLLLKEVDELKKLLKK